MPDGWEVQNALDPTTAQADEDSDQDGLPDALEHLYGTEPWNKYSDADEVMDGPDGWAKDPALSPPRLPEQTYVVIDLEPVLLSHGIGVDTYPDLAGLSDNGTVLFYYIDYNAAFGGDKSLAWNPGLAPVFLNFATNSISRNGRYVCGSYPLSRADLSQGGQVTEFTSKNYWDGTDVGGEAITVNSSGVTLGCFAKYASGPANPGLWIGVAGSGINFSTGNLLNEYAWKKITLFDGGVEVVTVGGGIFFIAAEIADDGMAVGRAGNGGKNFRLSFEEFDPDGDGLSTLDRAANEAAILFPSSTAAITFGSTGSFGFFAGLNSPSSGSPRGIVGGLRSGGIVSPKLWLLSGGTKIPVENPIARAPGGAEIPSLSGYSHDINDPFQIIGNFTHGGKSFSLVHNGMLANPKPIDPDWTVKFVHFINNSGAMVGHAAYQAEETWRKVLLLPVEIEYHTSRMPANEWKVYSPLLPSIERTIGTVHRDPHWNVELKFKDDNNIFQNADLEWRSTGLPNTAQGKEVTVLCPAGDRTVALWVKQQHAGDVKVRTVNIRPITEEDAVANNLAAFAAGTIPSMIRDEANTWAWNNRTALGGGYHNGGTDAGKHSYFNALGVITWGLPATVDLAEAHEHENVLGGGMPNESCMDMIHYRPIGA